MKKFDGIHPEAYDTIFGIINIEIDTSDDDGMLVIKQVTQTPIRIPTIVDNDRVVGMRRFYEIQDALEYIEQLEQTTISKIKKIYDEVL